MHDMTEEQLKRYDENLNREKTLAEIRKLGAEMDRHLAETVFTHKKSRWYETTVILSAVAVGAALATVFIKFAG